MTLSRMIVKAYLRQPTWKFWLKKTCPKRSTKGWTNTSNFSAAKSAKKHALGTRGNQWSRLLRSSLHHSWKQGRRSAGLRRLGSLSQWLSSKHRRRCFTCWCCAWCSSLPSMSYCRSLHRLWEHQCAALLDLYISIWRISDTFLSLLAWRLES